MWFVNLCPSFFCGNSPERKKMVAVHLTTIPCEPIKANRHLESHIFGENFPCTNNIVYVRFKVFRTFLYIFMSVFRVFLG